MKTKWACLFVLLSSVAMTWPLNAQTTVTLNGSSGSNTNSDSYSTDGGLNLGLGLAVEYLIVGGGGSGVDGYGGGGGAGGFRTGAILLGNSTSAIFVGAGGAAADLIAAGAGNNGTNSSAFAITALGGGAGGTYATGAPNSGGSGGGAGSINAQAGGAGSVGQGNNGGAGFRNANTPSTLTGGGGGGAGAAGQSGTISSGGAGGAGLSSDITGSTQWYAGGGGGSGFRSGGGPTGGAGGQGGGGAGGAGNTFNGTAGTANTGGGGGGAQSNDQGFNVGVGGAGGSGVVIARYQGTALGTGGTVTSGTGSATGFTLHSFTSIGNSALNLTGLDTRLGATLTTSVTGSGGLTYTGPGTLTLAANSTYSGSTTITAGTLQVGDGGTTGSLGAGSVANNASLVFNRGNHHSVSNAISGAGSLTKSGSGVMTLSGNNTYSGGTAVNAGTLQVGNGGTTGNLGTGEITLGAGSTLAFNRSDSVSLDNDWVSFNVLSGVFTVRNEGAGLVTLSDSAKNIGANFGNGVTFVLDGTGRGQIDQSVASGGSDMAIRKTGTGTWTLANVANNYTGSTTITAGTLEVTGRLGAGNYARAIANDGELHINTTSEQVLSGDISGTGQLRKSSAGTLTLSGNNTYSGGTAVNAGELNVNGSIAGSAVSVSSGASLSGSGTVGAISGAGAINPGNSPGILTAPSVDPSGGLSFNFEFTSLNPTYSNASASANDVLRLTDTTPFVASLGAVNTVNIYFNVDVFEEGQLYTGGFFTDAQGGFLDEIVNASFNYYVKDASGTFSYGGQTYAALGAGLAIDLTTINQSADFAGGAIDGQVVQFEVIPEPSTYALLALAAAALGVHLIRRRRSSFARQK